MRALSSLLVLFLVIPSVTPVDRELDTNVKTCSGNGTSEICFFLNATDDGSPSTCHITIGGLDCERCDVCSTDSGTGGLSWDCTSLSNAVDALQTPCFDLTSDSEEDTTSGASPEDTTSGSLPSFLFIGKLISVVVTFLII